jgi:cytochrome P450
MSVPKTVPVEPHQREAAEDAGTAASAGRCPVDHAAGVSAVTSTSPESIAPGPSVAIPAATLPGPRMPILLQMITYWMQPAAFVERCRDRYGSRFALRVRRRPLYVLTDPEDVRQMFLAPADVLHTGNGSVVLEKYFGHTGLAWLDEGEHKTRRKHIMQCLHGTALQRIEASVTEMARQEIAKWPQGRTIALYPLIYRLTLNVIREVIFGSARLTRWEELLDVLMHMVPFNYKITASMLIHKMPPARVRLLAAIRPLGLHDFFKLRERADALIAEALQERRNAGEPGDDMLSVLLGISHDDGSPLTDTELRDEIMTMFVAGTETTAAAIAWAFEHLSREHAVRDRLVAEIDQGEGDAYLTATTHEVLRVRPPIPQIIVREAMKPIEIGGVRYEPRTLMMASPWLLHRNMTLYPDPEAFRPERFLGTKPGMYTWIPFGGGRIRCLGAPIAEFEIKAVLREVLSRFELHRTNPRPEKVRLHLAVVVPAKGTRLKLRPRSPQPG